MIPFNKPTQIGAELTYIAEAIKSGKISGDGIFTKKCHQYFEERYGFKKCLLTTSCTDALEMAALLIDIKEGDEVIMPSYTFVSTSNAFVLRGAKIIFVESEKNTPNMDVSQIEALITPKTKAIVPVHYAGVACDMDEIMRLADKYNLFVIEDAAQAIDSFYKGKPLGGIGHFAAFSFHETKNIISGEGGMLVINDEKFVERAEIIREKGTNRSKFFRGEVDKYGWVDIGSSFLPSDITAAYLFAQLEELDKIQAKRLLLWDTYNMILSKEEYRRFFDTPVVHDYATNNAHMYYIVCNNIQNRDGLIKALKQKGYHAVFHYQSLHKSAFYSEIHGEKPLPQVEHYSECLIRLPMYYDLAIEDAAAIANTIIEYFS